MNLNCQDQHRMKNIFSILLKNLELLMIILRSKYILTKSKIESHLKLNQKIALHFLHLRLINLLGDNEKRKEKYIEC